MSYFNLTKTKNNLIGFIIQNNFYSFSQHRCNEYAPISNSIRFSSLKDPGAVFLSNCFQIKHLTPLVSKRLIKSSVFFFFFNRAENMNKKTTFEKVSGMWFYKTKDVPCGWLPTAKNLLNSTGLSSQFSVTDW